MAKKTRGQYPIAIFEFLKVRPRGATTAEIIQGVVKAVPSDAAPARMLATVSESDPTLLGWGIRAALNRMTQQSILIKTYEYYGTQDRPYAMRTYRYRLSPAALQSDATTVTAEMPEAPKRELTELEIRARRG